MAEAKATSAPTGCLLPRVTIQFCTQCKWMLRAAYVRVPPYPAVHCCR
jgi:hypothetical protein